MTPFDKRSTELTPKSQGTTRQIIHKYKFFKLPNKKGLPFNRAALLKHESMLIS